MRGGPSEFDGESNALSSARLGSPPVVGLSIDPAIGLPIVSWSLAAAFGVVLFAFLIRRSVWDEPPMGGDHRSAFAAQALEPATTLTGSPAPGPTAPVVRDTRPDIPPGEANLPRWLRPSLREQRQSGHSGRVTRP